MPIRVINPEENGSRFDFVAAFGEGDMAAKIAEEDNGNGYGLIFQPSNKGEIGRLSIDDDFKRKTNRLILHFKNIESLEITIKNLEDLKKVMLGEKDINSGE